ncbi:4140_t:CDS:2 [Acaulospora colombiana]|uniref:4140_t:CDS:1 n=1 Tax=Acaulospora colombiana TaxID=27376 RepID=A0ACA9MP65_9GLOM|nr:4140_t:CDS:2 [Acaulospora colombiana]
MPDDKNSEEVSMENGDEGSADEVRNGSCNVADEVRNGGEDVAEKVKHGDGYAADKVGISANEDDVYQIPSAIDTVMAQTIDVLGSAADAIKPFLPFFEIITSVSKSVLSSYEGSQYNRRTCGVLLTRVETAECAVKSLVRQKEERISDFRSQDFYNSFVRFARVMEKIQKFVENISQLSKFRRFISNQAIKDNLKAILKDFDACANDLHLSISINIKDQTRKDLEILHSDLEQMAQFLENIDLHVTDLMRKVDSNQEYNEKMMAILNNTCEQVSMINSKIKKKVRYQAKQILLEELTGSSDTNGRRGHIVKKIYKGMDVACKKVTVETENKEEVERFESQLAILEKLHHCDYIIRFYGILNSSDDEKIMVYEWSENGNLREAYEKYNIPWGKKLNIALGICRGLVFLNATKIYHHDIRCENILMTSQWEPKIANFKISRWVSAKTKKYIDPIASLNWMAPEKIKGLNNPDKNRYTAGCEIFR